MSIKTPEVKLTVAQDRAFNNFLDHAGKACGYLAQAGFVEDALKIFDMTEKLIKLTTEHDPDDGVTGAMLTAGRAVVEAMGAAGQKATKSGN